MTFDQFFRIIRARWLLAAATLAFFIGVTLIVSLLLPKTYEATATVMADFKPDPVAGMSQLTGIQPVNYLATQVDLIKSSAVATRVVRDMRLDQTPDMHERWMSATKGRGDMTTWTGELLSKGLIVKPSRESNVIEISYQAADPRFAAAMANAFTKAYMDTALQIRIDPARQYYGFFEERARLAREKYERAQERLAQAQREKGIVITDERLDAENNRLNEISTQIAALRAQAADASNRSRQASTRADQMQDVLNSPVVASLKADLARVESKLQELSARMGDAHPQVIEAKASADNLRQQIRAETARLRSSLNINSSIAYAREGDAVSAYEQQRAKLLKMKQERNELQVLEREVETAQRIYEAIQTRQSQMGLESNNNQNNITLLQAATEPSKHTFPRVFLNLLLAASVGTLFAIVFVLLAEMFDRRIRGVQDLIQGTGLPVIGIMPTPNPATWSRRIFKHVRFHRQTLPPSLPTPPSGSIGTVRPLP
ncbi:MAG TPA: chain length determinant protein EpsF [Aquabacterium sp.]|nr:chain length determinant protein EpsF [Aquabacterium sp.]